MNAKTYAAIKTAIITFGTIFAVSLLGFLNDVASWAGSTDSMFPSVSPLGKAAVAALAAAAVGLVNFFVNYGQEKGVVPGEPASYVGKPSERPDK